MNNLAVVSQLSGLEVLRPKKDHPDTFLNPPKNKIPKVICDLEIHGLPPSSKLTTTYNDLLNDTSWLKYFPNIFKGIRNMGVV